MLAELLHIDLLDIKMLNMKTLSLRTLAAPVMWGTTYLTVTELLPGESPLVVAAMRVAPAGLLLLAVARSTGWWMPAGAEWLRTSALALANFAVFFPLLTVAVERLPGGVAAAFGGLQPLFVAVLARALLGTQPTRVAVGIAVVAAFGVALVAIRPGADADPVGIAAAIAANGSFALGVVLTNRFGAPRHRIAATGWQLLVAAALLVLLALAVDGPPAAPTAANLVGYLHLSVIATAGAFLIWFHGIAGLPVAAPPLLGLAAPVTGATLGWIVLEQQLTPLQLVGFAATIAAIAWGATMSSRTASATSTAAATSPRAVADGILSDSCGSSLARSCRAHWPRERLEDLPKARLPGWVVRLVRRPGHTVDVNVASPQFRKSKAEGHLCEHRTRTLRGARAGDRQVREHVVPDETA
jgi:probable blue pigment (indigoidine) exporter